MRVPSGVHFAVWAPNAQRVSVVGDFNDWDGRRHVDAPCAAIPACGKSSFPASAPGALYKYEIVGADGQAAAAQGRSLRLRSGDAARRPPRWSPSPTPFDWNDAASSRRSAPTSTPRRAPISIYEVHLGSWRRGDDGGFLTYDELADQLIPYVADMGFTHIELMPITEHPLDPSWGYQPTGLYRADRALRRRPPASRASSTAPTRPGSACILDWVPAHFPTDEHGLARFDGTALYEHADPRRGYHPDWNTAIYNFGRSEVAAFLINNALFWLERFHVDGLRVDAVASMLYLDYSRKAGEWIPNQFGGNENLEAVAFLQRMNRAPMASIPAS